MALPSRRPQRSVSVPIRIHVRGGRIDGDRLRDAIAGSAGAQLARAFDILDEHGEWRPDLAPLDVRFTGAAAGLSDDEKRVLYARVGEGVTHGIRGAHAQRRGGRTKPASKPPKQQRTARVAIERKLAFRATPRRFFDVLGSLEQPIDTALYHDVLDVPHDGVVLHVRTEGMMFLDELRPLVEEAVAGSVPKSDDYYYALVWHARGLRHVIELDRTALAPLAGAHLSSPTVVERLLYVHPGSRMVVAAIRLPHVTTRTQTAPDGPEDFSLALRELAPLVDPAEFVAATSATWASYLAEWGGDPITATVFAFTVHKPVHATTLRSLYTAVANGDRNGLVQLGGLILLTRRAARDLPTLLLDESSNAATLALPDTAVNGPWLAGWRGAYISAWLPRDSFKLAAARCRPGARALAATVVQLLTAAPYHVEFRLYDAISDELGSGYSYRRTIEDSRDAFEFFLEQLDAIAPKGAWIERLYNTAEGHYGLFELLVRFGNASSHVHSAVVRRATARIGARRAAAREHGYTDGAVLVDRRWWLRKGAVMAAGNPMYLVRKASARLKKSAEAKVGGWCLAGAQRVVARALAARRELSKEEFSREVLEEVQAQITDDDVEQIEIERSLRLVDVRAHDDHGIKRHFVKFHWVERIVGEGDWSAAEVVLDEHGRPIVVEKEDSEFEEMVWFWSYARSSVAIIAFSKGVTYLGTFVVAGAAGVFALVPYSLGFVAFNTLLYIGKAALGGEFSIEGLFVEAVKGYAMALGFQLFAPIGRFVGVWAAQTVEKFGIDLFVKGVAGYLVQRAVSGAIIGGGSSVLTHFATDLVYIAMGAKSGFSGWRDYLDALAVGAKWGIVFEFGIDAFRRLGKLDSVRAVGAAVQRARWSPSKWWIELSAAEAKLRAWLVEVVGQVRGLQLRELMDAFAREVGALKSLVVEGAKQSILRRILTLSKVELTPLGYAGLQRFLDAIEARAAEPILRALAKDPSRAARFFDALATLDESLVAILANRGHLAALAESARLVELLATRSIAAIRVLDALHLDVAAAERFLAELDALPLAAREQGLRFFEGGGALVSPALLVRALRHATLIRPTLRDLIVRLEQAAIPATALDDLLATLSRIGWKRLETVSVAELKALASSSELRAYLHAHGEVAAFDLIAALRGDLALIAHFAGRHGALSSQQLATLKMLSASGVRVSAFARGSGPTLPEFTKVFAEYTAGEQAYVLSNASGRAPVQVLQQARETRERLAESARNMEPTPEQLAEEIATNTRRQARRHVIEKHRTGAHQTAISLSVLRKNVQELARMRRAIRDFNPDAIIGTERGGAFIADAATSAEPALASLVVRIPKADFNQVIAKARAEIEALIRAGKKRFVFTDVYFYGSGYNKLQKDLIGTLATAHPDCLFRGMWLREQLGFEEAIEGGTALLSRARASKFSNVGNEHFVVPFAIGDDVERLLQKHGSEPIFLFNTAGVIEAVVMPRPGESTRDLILRLLREGKD